MMTVVKKDGVVTRNDGKIVDDEGKVIGQFTYAYDCPDYEWEVE